MEGKMTVLFESPFWVGIFEKQENGMCQAARFVFGAEPTDPQLLEFARTVYGSLDFSRPVPVTEEPPVEMNFKRRMREVRKQMSAPPGTTRSRQIIQQEYELQARERETGHREAQEADEQRKFHLRQIKRAEKHRGH